LRCRKLESHTSPASRYVLQLRGASALAAHPIKCFCGWFRILQSDEKIDICYIFGVVHYGNLYCLSVVLHLVSLRHATLDMWLFRLRDRFEHPTQRFNRSHFNLSVLIGKPAVLNKHLHRRGVINQLALQASYIRMYIVIAAVPFSTPQTNQKIDCSI